MAFSLKNITAHPSSTVSGVLMGALQAAIVGAAQNFATTGNTSDWKAYAWAAGAAAAPIIVGSLYAPAKPSAPDPKAEMMAKVDAALQSAAEKAMAEEVAKLGAQPQ